MRIRRISVQQIIDYLNSNVIRVYGETNKYIDNLADYEHTNVTTLDWVNPKKKDKQSIVENSPANVLLVDESIGYSDVLSGNNKTLIVVKNPKLELARIGNEFFSDRIKYGIHPSCVIDPESDISEQVSIAPFTYIGKAKIGSGCIIGSHVRIYDNVEIGEHCNIKDGAVIGGAGFGFEKDENGNRFRFPQIGDVKIGNFVEIGANTCIDRGALSTTSIGDYTKINNLCHIAHNNTIGKNVVVAGLVNLSGGNIIEDDCWIAPQSTLKGYVHLGKGCIVGTGAVVIKDIPAGEVWVGNPAKKLR